MQRILGFVSVTVLFAFVSGCRPAAAPVSISELPIPNDRMRRVALEIGPVKPVAELGWKILDGERQQIGDLRGKVIVLDFWATYCPPCIEEIPHLKELQAKFGEKGFQVIGLHVGGDEDLPRVPAFVKKLDIDYPLARPDDSLMSQLIGNDTRIPQTLVFDRSGNLVKRFVSYDDTIRRALDLAVEAAVSGDLPE